MARIVLCIDDDQKLLRLVEYVLDSEGLDVATASTGADGLDAIETVGPDAVVLDLNLPDVHGRQVLERIRSDHAGLPVVILTSSDEIDEAVDCMKLGAVDFVQKPFDEPRLVASVKNALTQGNLRTQVELLTHELRRGEGLDSILGRSKAIDKVREMLRRAAASDVTVLLEGESGTGKEVAARAIHSESARRSGPFIAVNCAAIPENLIESELFGHEKGAFTGATSLRKGNFEMADGGTIFLDEIGELRLDLQTRLLRVLQERKVQRVGSTQERKVDVRVVAATNRELLQAARDSEFREDLYYRLAVFPVRMPPLRERADDVLLLAQTFLVRAATHHGKAIDDLTPEARRALRNHSWPGNVRELQNVLERAIILEDSDRISLGSLTDEVVAAIEDGLPAGDAPSPTAGGADDGDVEGGEILPFEVEEKRILSRALHRTGWNVRDAARRLGLGRATLYRKIERYGLKRS